MSKVIADTTANSMVQHLYKKMDYLYHERDTLLFDLYRSWIKKGDVEFAKINPGYFEPITNMIFTGNGINHHKYLPTKSVKEQKLIWFPYLREKGLRMDSSGYVVINFNAFNLTSEIECSSAIVKADQKIEARKKEIEKITKDISIVLLGFTTLAKAIEFFPACKDYIGEDIDTKTVYVPSKSIAELTEKLKG